MEENTNDEMNNQNGVTVSCPDCGVDIAFVEQPEVGDVVVCENEECGVELEVVNEEPVEVEYLMIQK